MSFRKTNTFEEERIDREKAAALDQLIQAKFERLDGDVDPHKIAAVIAGCMNEIYPDGQPGLIYEMDEDV